MSAKKDKAKRQRRGRIFRQRRLEDSLGEILRSNKVTFLFDETKLEKLQFAVAVDKEIFRTALYHLSLALRGLLQLYGVYEQMIVAYRMAKRYPWDTRTIKRSEHLHFVWMVFVNLCYIVEEKFKLAAKSHNSAISVFKLSGEIKVNDGVKRISRSLRQQIQARGEFTHQWRRSHDIIGQYQTIELAHSLGPEKFEVTKAFALSSLLISFEMEKAIRIVEDILLEMIEGHKTSLMPTSSRMTNTLKTIEKAQTAKVRKGAEKK